MTPENDRSHATESASRVPDARTALVTGATGYVGGLLVPRLLEAGWRVLVLSRSRERVASTAWSDDVDIVTGDASDPRDLATACEGVDVAYYLLHSMDGEGDFRERDRELAELFARACEDAAVGRVVYLGGLLPQGEQDLSDHLASRAEVGQVFLDSRVPAACLQAGMVLGAGSASFEVLRHLTERLPAMGVPPWLHQQVQPIAVDDALHYLVGAAELDPELNRTFDIGGPDVDTYVGLVERYAQVAGIHRRPVVTVPLITPELASYWIALVTPVDLGLARPLVGSLRHDMVCHEDDLSRLVGPPPGGATSFEAAVRAALADSSPRTFGRNVRRAAGMVAACAVAGSLASDPNSRWYRSLDLPSWQPPKAAFPIAWTTLYAAIAAVSASATTQLDDEARDGEATAYWRALGGNLALNAGWSALFFRARRPWLAAAGAAALATSSADLMRRAGSVSRGHGIALAPYPAWCAFATALSTEIARRNP
ncbi:tryptophan-rich sensory protein [Actinomycetota bacterium]